MRTLTLLFVSCLSLSGCTKPTPDTLVTSGYDEQAMEAAISKARSNLGKFIATLSDPNCTSHSVKVPVTEGDLTEHFWLTEISYKEEEGTFFGTINNEPGLVGNVKMGQEWKCKQDDISDWLYFENGRMEGNYTLVPLLDTMPEKEREEILAMWNRPE